jgi:hypothetical protein
MWKKVAMISFKILPKYLPGGAEENHGKYRG